MKPNTVILGFSDSAAPDNTLASNRLLKSIRNARIGRDEVVEYFTGDDFLPQVNRQKLKLNSFFVLHARNDLPA